MFPTWYGMEKALDEQFNKGKDFSNRYVYRTNVYFKDLLNKYEKSPEDFTPSMVLDLDVAVLSKVRALLTHHLTRGKDKEIAEEQAKNYEAIMKVALDSGEEYDKNHRSLVAQKGIFYPISFSSDLSTYSSKGRKLYVSEVKALLENMTIFSDKKWHKNITADIFFNDVSGKNIQKTIAFKNFLIFLEKAFPLFKEDEKFKTIKKDFFQSYYDAVDLKRGFYDYPFTDLMSFLKDSYDENTLKKVVKEAGDNVAYSYLKNKAAFDKIIQNAPEAKEVLATHMSAIEDDKIPDIFNETSYKIMTLDVNLKAVEKILLLEKVKVTSYDLNLAFQGVLKDEYKNKNPLSGFFLADVLTSSPTSHNVSFLFKVPNEEIDNVGEPVIKDFLKKMFSKFVNEYPKVEFKNHVDALWSEYILTLDADKLPQAESGKTLKVNKF